MAELTPTVVGKFRHPIGGRFVFTVRVTITNANAGDEFFKIPGCSWIDRMVGFVAISALNGADEADVPVLMRNTKVGTTTGVEDTVTAGGWVSIEGNARAWEFTFIGRN